GRGGSRSAAARSAARAGGSARPGPDRGLPRSLPRSPPFGGPRSVSCLRYVTSRGERRGPGPPGIQERRFGGLDPVSEAVPREYGELDVAQGGHGDGGRDRDVTNGRDHRQGKPVARAQEAGAAGNPTREMYYRRYRHDCQ